MGGSAWGALLESAVAVVGSQAETSEAGKRGEGGAGRAGAMAFPLGGTSSRVDFSLQPSVVESDYKGTLYRCVVESKPITCHR